MSDIDPGAAFVSVAAGTLAVVFLWAGLSKVLAPRRWRNALEPYRLGRLESVAAVVVPSLEVSVAFALAAGASKVAAASSLAMVGAFSLALLRARSGAGDRLPCACFGRGARRDYRTMLARNAAIASLAAVVLVASPGASSAPRLDPAQLLPAALALVGAAAGVWTVVRVVHMTGRGSRS